MPKVMMLPTPSQAARDTTNAIHQTVLKLAKFLPEYGWQVTENEDEADIIAGHAGQTGGVHGVDVAICHGLYPTAHHPDHAAHWGINTQVIHNLRTARQITVPSDWVADILRRDMHINPHIIPWAIEADEWEPGENMGYVLWNKTRTDAVCNPAPLLELAKRTPGGNFVTTFGNGGENVKTIGRQPYLTMREYVRHAGVYLATTKETFGIATLEAMACGVPILGYSWGATADIVQHGVTGYLVPPGDIDALSEGLQYCRDHRNVLGSNARQVAAAYTWRATAERFAAVFDVALQGRVAAPKVSVIIPLHNYGHFLPDAVQSVLSQKTGFEIEVIIVDDHSTDDSLETAQHLVADVTHARVIQTPENAGPAIARNTGIAEASGEYIVCLDSDDKLGSDQFLQLLADTLDGDRALGIAFSGMSVMTANGDKQQPAGWPNGYDFEKQLKGHNQIPTCCMFRRTAWARVGGYRSNIIPSEDADLWLRIGLIGYKAKQATTAPWFVYRLHDDSLTGEIRAGKRSEPPWAHQHRRALAVRPFASDGTPERHSFAVRNYDTPEISVVIPVGPGHEKYLPDALDSVEAQTFWNWECIIVIDGDAALPDHILTAYPWVKVYTTGQTKGAGAARNVGIQHARGKFLAFLDADDLWKAEFLERTLKAFRRTGRYIYTDWISIGKDGQVTTHQSRDYEPCAVFRQSSLHSISVLIPRRDVLDVGGFDETLASWEDTEFFMKLAAAGYCGQRLSDPLLIYRYKTGSRRELALTIQDELKATLRSRFSEFMEGKMGCGCGSGKRSTIGNVAAHDANMVRVMYDGEGVPTGATNLRGTATGQSYGHRRRGEVFFVWPQDLAAMPDVLHKFEDFDVPPLAAPALAAPRRVG